MKLFKRAKEKESEPVAGARDTVLEALLRGEEITREKALNIPAVLSSVDLIANTFAVIPFKLYKLEENEGKKKTVEVTDYRVDLVNNDTKAGLDGFQLKRAIVEDYLLDKGAYIYIKKSGNIVKALKYVEPSFVTYRLPTSPLESDFSILVNGQEFNSFDFVKLLRNTKNGAYGTGLTSQINEILQVAYQRILFEKDLMSTSGAKRGFLQSTHRLSPEAIQVLKESWTKFYSGAANAMILNDGVKFEEASSTSSEIQLVEKNKIFSREVAQLFNIDESYDLFIKKAIIPIATAFEAALNRELLLESEKGSYYWRANFDELLKGDIKKRYEAYKIAINSGFKSINEIRYLEGDNELEGLDVVTLSLAQVLYNTQDGTIYTPNTNQLVKLGDPVDPLYTSLTTIEGGEINANTDTE